MKFAIWISLKFFSVNSQQCCYCNGSVLNLCRAVYRDADLYLLDDPLSAVDTHVGKHLFEECIVKLLAGKTRVLVTHQVQHLADVSTIAILSNVRTRDFS